jgi:carotenoid cleavage dioxygenase-like enzyme
MQTVQLCCSAAQQPYLHVTPAAGTIPRELSGTLLRNGPGLFEVGGQPISQPLDGDGMVRRPTCSACLADI